MFPLDLQLLNLRKRYKNTSLSYINLQTQAIFLSACLHHNLAPRIRLRCMTPKRNLSNVQDVFTEYLEDTESVFIEIFRNHLRFVAAKLLVELQAVLWEIDLTTNLATTSELLSHQHFQSATEKNVEKEAKWRCHLAQRKLQGLSRADFRLRTRNNQGTSDDQLDDPRIPTLQPAVVPNIREMDQGLHLLLHLCSLLNLPPLLNLVLHLHLLHSLLLMYLTQPPSVLLLNPRGCHLLYKHLLLEQCHSPTPWNSTSPSSPTSYPLSPNTPTPTNSLYPLTYPSQKPFSTQCRYLT